MGLSDNSRSTVHKKIERAVFNTLQLATRKHLIKMSSGVITIVTQMINYCLFKFSITICSLKSKTFSLCSVTSEMENNLRTANGPIRHLEFLRNFNKRFRTFKALTNNLP
jgi:hypothetical protein